MPRLGVGLEWEQVHRVSPPVALVCRGCGAPMSAKSSSRGLRFFAHRSAAPGCPSQGETIAHRLLKIELVTAARDAGWHAELEIAGNGWRADVLATSPDGTRRIAFEAQLASCTIEDLDERTATMRADGVEVCWVTDRDVTAPAIRDQFVPASWIALPQWMTVSSPSTYAATGSTISSASCLMMRPRRSSVMSGWAACTSASPAACA
jgi:hypothetical protein